MFWNGVVSVPAGWGLAGAGLGGAEPLEGGSAGGVEAQPLRSATATSHAREEDLMATRGD
ncbi:MAG TPA: hypothetical protein VMS88_00555 [Terriglobales bacterium]|nr:hypothetical protein [Terriglobales bacterium]